MTPPAGAPTRCFLATFALLAATEAFADESPAPLRQPIQRQLPRYDPTAYEKAQAEKAVRDAAVQKALAALPAKPAAPVTPAPPADAPPAPRDDTLELPTMTVRPTYEPPKRLPRLDAPKPLHDLKPEPLESPAGRHARLMKKHLTPFQRALSRVPILGMGIAGSAHDAESREQKAAQMNSLADGLEMQELLGRDPAEIKKLRAEYQKLYYSGPKN
jgi:hypothetical protein